MPNYYAGFSSLSLYAVDKLELNVDRVVYGSLMTSLEMAGVSLTLLKVEQGWDHYIGRNTIENREYS